MPIPQPRRGETQEAFLGRCMADFVMGEDYPERGLRWNVCVAQLGGEQVVKQTSASHDLRLKLELEQYLLRTLRAHNTALTQTFIRGYATTGVAPPLTEDAKAVEAMLQEHYGRVQGLFSGRINNELPREKRATREEEAAIAAALAAYFASRAQEQASIIHATTMADQQQAVTQARADQPDLSIQETAVVAGAVLSRWFRAREQSTAITETQAAAEATKATEAEVLSGVAPTVTGGSGRTAEPTKTWDSVGDSHVREAHLVADGQEVPVNEPFVVDGEQLMFPGDTSLGASTGNVINCRCGSTYDAAAIAEGR